MNVRILIVDDEKEILNAVGNFLQLEGFKVETAENGQIAIEKLEKEDFQIVITDLNMPVADGFELLAHIAHSQPGLPAIVMTSIATAESEAALSKLGIGGYLKKPFDLLSLTDKIMDGLAGKEKGYMQGVTLPSFLQLIEMEAKTCTLKIESDGKTGYLYFDKGNVLDAKTDENSGLEALQEVLLWDDTAIEINHICLKKQKHIHMPLAHVLLDTLRLKDETDRQADQIFSDQTKASVTAPDKAAPKVRPAKKAALGRFIIYGEGQSMVIPTGTPVLTNMNTYYLHIPKLIEFFVKSSMVGLVHFKAPQNDGWVLFGEKNVENVFFKSGKESLFGGDAIEKLTETAEKINFSVDIQKVAKGAFDYWAKLAHTVTIHKNLDSEFTSLQKLITKLTSESLTGYIEVSVTNTNESGAIFFYEGKIVGGAFSWEDSMVRDSTESLALLIDKSQRNGASFTVKSAGAVDGAATRKMSATSMVSPKMMLGMLQETMIVFEKLIDKKAKGGNNFTRILKQKFVDKADDYPYLDPFSGEFSYEDGEIVYDSDTPVGDMCGGLVDCLGEIADELGIRADLKKALEPVEKKYPVAMQTCATVLVK